MKKKLMFIPLVILCLVAIDIVVRLLCSYSYQHIPKESLNYRNYQYALNESKVDMLIVGASCGIHGYNPNLLSDSLHIKVINASMDGQPVCYQCITARHFLKDGDCKTIIVDITAPQLEDYWKQNIDLYKPFYWQNDEAKEYVDKVRPWYEKIKMLSACYQYNGSLLSIFRNTFGTDCRGKDGWLPIPYTGQPAGFEEKMSTDELHPDSLNLVYLNNLVKECKDKHIRLILCKSPGITGSKTFNDYMAVYAQKNGIEFWNYNRLKGITDDQTLFKDGVHLNEKGAEKFSQVIAERLKNGN